MQLRRSESGAVCESYVKVKNLAAYVRLIIDIYSSSAVTSRFWLTDREKDFYVATVIHVILGYPSPISEESLQIYKKYFTPEADKKSISDYLGRVRKKNWLKYDKKEKVVELPAIFNGIEADADMITFNLRYDYVQADRQNTD